MGKNVKKDARNFTENQILFYRILETLKIEMENYSSMKSKIMERWKVFNRNTEN